MVKLWMTAILAVLPSDKQARFKTILGREPANEAFIAEIAGTRSTALLAH